MLENQLTARLKILQLTVKNPARFDSKSPKMATLQSRFKNVIFQDHCTIEKSSSFIEIEQS